MSHKLLNLLRKRINFALYAKKKVFRYTTKNTGDLIEIF